MTNWPFIEMKLLFGTVGRPTCTCRINWSSVDLVLFVSCYFER